MLFMQWSLIITDITNYYMVYGGVWWPHYYLEFYYMKYEYNIIA